MKIWFNLHVTNFFVVHNFSVSAATGACVLCRIQIVGLLLTASGSDLHRTFQLESLVISRQFCMPRRPLLGTCKTRFRAHLFSHLTVSIVADNL